jgi:hypothetical protein
LHELKDFFYFNSMFNKNHFKKLPSQANSQVLKKCAFASILLLLGTNAKSQRTCGTIDYLEYQIQRDPSVARALQEADLRLQAPDERLAGEDEILTIPVVVHVVYNTPTENISSEQIESQIAILNEDYRRLNSNGKNTPGAFKAVAADVHIQFRLAGITRTSTKKTSFTYNDDVKHASTGGINAWDATRYLNIWVCSLGNNLLGYAQFPGLAAATDGVVIKNSAFGLLGSVKPPFALGRTATHEIGHWLNLNHIWGDKNDCKGNDHVEDTPVQQTSNSGCPSFPHVTCKNGPDGDMYMNYMDYTDDACMNIFTMGQKKRMMAVLSNIRTTIADKKGLGLLNLGTDGKMTSFSALPLDTKAGDWQYNATNTIYGTGDFNGDGLTDILLTDEKNIGIISNSGGVTWSSILVKSNNSKFGKWLFNSDDVIEAIADFNGDGKMDILIRNDKAIGILSLKGKTFTTLAMLQNNGLAGSWRYNASAIGGKDSIRQIGDFDGDKKSDICISSILGFGILSLKGSKLTSLLTKANGTNFEKWTLDTQTNFFPAKGDFNKDGKDDILLTGPQGIALFTLNGKTLSTLAYIEEDARLGDWVYNSSKNDRKDIIQQTGDFNGDHQTDILLTSETGMALLTLKGETMTTILTIKNQSKIHNWTFDSNDDTILGTGDFDGDKTDDIFIQSDQGIGVFHIVGASLKPLDTKSYKTTVGSWFLTDQDQFIATGNFHSDKKKSILFKTDYSADNRKNTVVKQRKQALTSTEEPGINVFRLKIYPNPTMGLVTFEYTLLEPEKVSLTLYSFSGTKLKDLIFEENQEAGHYNKTFNFAALDPGIYTLLLRNGKANVASKLIIADKP